MNPLNFMVKGIKSPFPRFLALQPVANMFSRSHYYFIKIYPILDPAVYNYSSNFRDFIFLLTLRNISKMLVTKVRIKTIPAFVLYNRGIRIQFYTMKVFVFSFVQYGDIHIQFCTMEVFVFSFVQYGGIHIPFCTMEVFMFSFIQYGGIRIPFCTMVVFVFSFLQ